ncbi:MAG: hypothetical protein JKY54_17240 [Flavobacteriales bacterium]|nr:hypothetical protein [Flavobacteriales bacterium]
MMRRILFILLAAVVGFSSQSYAQKNKPIEGGAVFWLNDGSKIIGKLLDDDLWNRQVEIVTGDTINIDHGLITKLYLPQDIALYKRSRFHYKRGGLLNFSMGASEGNVAFNLSYNQRISQRLEFGGGIGYHYNSFNFSTANEMYFVGVHSMPMFVQGKYIFRFGPRIFYAKARLGYANNYRSWGITQVKDGITMHGAVGLTFSSKSRLKHFIELGQYTSHASGVARNFSGNALSDIGFNVWFNNVVVTYGIEIGR